MKIGIVNASSQKDKNPILERELRAVAKGKSVEIINFGVYPSEEATYSYIQMSLAISLLLSTKAVDFVVTGCSSGTGMMLACNSLPDVVCGYAANPAEAYLFGQINAGNALSFPLGLNFGWAAELNLRFTLEKLIEQPFGGGYPKVEAERKQKDTAELKHLKYLSQKSLVDILPQLDKRLILPILQRPYFFDYLIEHGTDELLKKILLSYRAQESN